VTDPLEWPWSSARAHAGLERRGSRLPRTTCAPPLATRTTGASAIAPQSSLTTKTAALSAGPCSTPYRTTSRTT
jgi:hypothetical protein